MPCFLASWQTAMKSSQVFGAVQPFSLNSFPEYHSPHTV